MGSSGPRPRLRLPGGTLLLTACVADSGLDVFWGELLCGFEKILSHCSSGAPRFHQGAKRGETAKARARGSDMAGPCPCAYLPPPAAVCLLRPRPAQAGQSPWAQGGRAQCPEPPPPRTGPDSPLLQHHPQIHQVLLEVCKRDGSEAPARVGSRGASAFP